MPDGGMCFRAAIPQALLDDERSGVEWDDPRFLLLEDGRPLPRAVEIHDEIRQLGAGRYSLWGEEVYFSASDSSDPERSGRHYEIQRVPAEEGRIARFAPWVRIGFVGNINNIPFFFCEAARELGFEAYMYPVHSGALHDPRSRFADRSEPPWVRRIADFDDEELASQSPERKALVDDVRAHCDFVVLNGGLVPSLARDLGVPFVFFQTGSDVTYYGRYETAATVARSWKDDFRRSPAGREALLELTWAIALQRDAILGGAAFSGVHPPGLIRSVDEVLEDVGHDPARRVVMRAADLSQIPPRPWVGDAQGPDGLIVCSPTRVDFRLRPGDSELDDKGTELLLEGFARFLEGGGRGRLLLVEKGHDIVEARRIIDELGIGEQVEWFPELPFADYLAVMARAHLVCDAISLAGPAQITHDAMATGRPVLGNLRPEVFASVYDGGYPGFHAETAEDVCNGLTAAFESPRELEELGARSRAFVIDNLTPARALTDPLGRALTWAFSEPRAD